MYVDDSAEIQMAVDIIENAKTQRLGVCNACESLVVHSGIAAEALPQIVSRLRDHDVEIRATNEPGRSAARSSRLLRKTGEPSIWTLSFP